MFAPESRFVKCSAENREFRDGQRIGTNALLDRGEGEENVVSRTRHSVRVIPRQEEGFLRYLKRCVPPTSHWDETFAIWAKRR